MSSTRTFLLLSTGHLDAKSRAMLDAAAADTLVYMASDGRLPPGTTLGFGPADSRSAAGSLLAYPSPYGWICYAHDDEGILQAAGVTEVIMSILRYALKLGCHYVMFDADAEEVDGLPTFEWSEAA